jgi:hypothetical protein
LAGSSVDSLYCARETIAKGCARANVYGDEGQNLLKIGAVMLRKMMRACSNHAHEQKQNSLHTEGYNNARHSRAELRARRAFVERSSAKNAGMSHRERLMTRCQNLNVSLGRNAPKLDPN